MDLFACLHACITETAGEDQDSVAVFRDWPSLLDEALAREMAQDHFRYLAHYTYCDNVPPGFLPDLASLEFARAVNPTELGATDLREFVFKNVNRYDVEIFYRLPDLRQFRLDLSTATARSRALARSVIDSAPDMTFAGLEDFIRSRPELLRPYPSYFEIELTRAAPFQPVYLPRPADFESESAGRPRATEREPGGEVVGPHLDVDVFARLLAHIEAAFPGDATVALGGPGEPLRHPEVMDVTGRLLACASVRTVYLETFGVDLTPDRARELAGLPGSEKLVIIVRLATLRADRYLTLHGVDHLETVLAHIDACAALDERPFALYAELPRLAATADEVDACFERFAETSVQVLVGKFNSYAGRLPELRAADLTPLHRDFCWHLARDLYVTAEGRAAFCKQDPFARVAPAWDLRETDVATILSATAEHFAASLAGRHDRLPMPCARCDEWYTFNG